MEPTEPIHRCTTCGQPIYQHPCAKYWLHYEGFSAHFATHESCDACYKAARRGIAKADIPQVAYNKMLCNLDKGVPVEPEE